MPKKARDWKAENEEEALDAVRLVALIKAGISLNGYKIRIAKIVNERGTTIRSSKVLDCGCVAIGNNKWATTTIYRCTQHKGYSSRSKQYRYKIIIPEQDEFPS